MDELRRDIGATTDGPARARLRTELAGLLRATGELPGALAELRRAADEGPGLNIVRLAVLSAARALPALERTTFLAEIGHIARTDVPAWSAASADAQRESGRPVQAARAWLALAGDNRFPAHVRRAAARQTIAVAAGGLPAEHLAALTLCAAESTGRARLGFLREALALAPADGVDHPARLALVSAWIQAGGSVGRIEPLLIAAEQAGAPHAEEVTRLRREIERRQPGRGAKSASPSGLPATGGSGAPAASTTAASATASPSGATGSLARPRIAGATRATGSAAARAKGEATSRRAGVGAGNAGPGGKKAAGSRGADRAADGSADRVGDRPDPWERALVAARAGRGVLARRLAESALRSASRPSSGLAVVEAALRQNGLAKQALLLRRTQIEAEAPEARAAAIEGLIAEADAAGQTALGTTWRKDLPRVARAPGDSSSRAAALSPPPPTTPAEHYLAAQRQLIQLPPDGDTAPVLALLAHAVAGHPGADAALALGERLLNRSLDPSTKPAEARMIDLLRAAFDSEDRPSRRARIADRLAAALESDGDPAAALAMLDRAIGVGALEVLAPLRKRRARLLRQLGRARDLATALASDAQALSGRERLAALAERAQLLDAGGESERALAERLTALGELGAAAAVPPLGADGLPMPVLAPARRRLESTGRLEQSLRLAAAAVHHVSERGERLQLLRDIATLSEKAARDPSEVAMAWLAVVELDPNDIAAAESAERVLMATGEWERCADLLAWAAARTEAKGAAGEARRAPLLWRLAELRRSRLGQEDEALHLYRALGATSGPGAAGTFAARGRLQGRLVLHTARITVAPNPIEKAKAHLDRGLVILSEAGRVAEAEGDFSAALELDPRNVEVMGAFERLCERTQRWDELGHRLEQKAATLPPEAASRLWYGVGRVAERLEDLPTARAAYDRSVSLDGSLPEPVIALRRLATRRADWIEVARLLDLELGLGVPGAGDATRLVELASIVGEKLGDSDRALSLLERAGAVESSDPGTLDLLFRFSLASNDRTKRKWELAAQALERQLATGTEVPDVAERYFRVAADAEAAGRLDEALVFFSRSYSRNTSHRPTLERLSFICFEKGQWDNAWRATEALIDRYRQTLGEADLAELFARSALCDVHIAQRLSATAQLANMVTGTGAGVRDLADSWAAMRIEPRLLGGLEGDRRSRVLDRLRDALAVNSCPPAAKKQAWEIRGALAIIERRWADAREALEILSADPAADPLDRCGYLIAAGDIAMSVDRNAELAHRFYARARAVSAGDARLSGRGEQASSGAFADEIARDNTDEILR